MLLGCVLVFSHAHSVLIFSIQVLVCDEEK